MADTIFLAYAFRYRAVREAVKAAAEGIAEVECADDRLTGLHLLEKIQEQMLEAKVSLFDLTGHNVNVAVEYGLARGLSLLPIILYNDDQEYRPVENVPDIFSDLRGLDSLRYSSFDELTNALRQKLPNLLTRQRVRRPNEGPRPRLQMTLTAPPTLSETAFLIGKAFNAGAATANRVSCSLAGYIDPANHADRVFRIGTLAPNESRDVRLRYDDTGMLRQAIGWEHVLVEYTDDDGQRYEQRGKLIPYSSGGVIRSYTFDGLGPPKTIDRFNLRQLGLEEP